MRNLKKFLALVLAMMMTLSLMVSVNAKDITADFTDAESVTEEFQEGVDVLNGMKVFEGYEDGSFKPKNNITRAEVATIVYRLATGDWEGNQAHLYKDYQKFTDVNGDHWAAGYINYCANAEWIAGYGNGKFGPNDQVTGYQAAAMILRAVGYGKNGEFVGPTWQVQVANVTRSKNLLVNVNNTTYANTLNYPATRELVAEILFQAAKIPTVTWTMLNGYNEYPVALPSAGDAKNPSLGRVNYGLGYAYGIVVENQETTLNRKYTSLHVVDDDGNYYYDRTGVANSHEIVRLDLATGLNEYGHAYKVWFDVYANWNAAGTETTSTQTVYAAYDKVVKDELVWSNTANGNSINTGTNDELGTIAKALEFKVPATSATTDTFQTSDAFDAFKGDYTRANVNVGKATASPQKLYKLISNSSNSSLDAVISLNVEATKITAVNSNVTDANKKVVIARASSVVNDGASFLPQTLGATGTVVAELTNGGTTAPWTMEIFQSKLTANSTTTLKDYVVAYALGKCVQSDDIFGYNLHQQAETKQGTVTEYHVNATWDNTDPDYVVVGGEKLYKSPLYMAVADANAPRTDGIIPQVGAGVPADETYGNGTYEFLLDDEGRYIGAWPVASTNFIYGTYVDYTQETSSSAFKYYLTGVDQDGKQVTIPVTDARVDANNDGTWAVTDTMKAINGTQMPGVPYRDATGTATNGIGEGRYKAFVINGTKISNHADDLAVFNGLQVMNAGSTSTASATNFSLEEVVTIDKVAKTLGSVSLGDRDTTNDTSVTASTTSSNLFFTEKTKFVLVEGYGTESAKAQVYNGISDLLGDYKAVNFYLRDTDTVNPASRNMKHAPTGAKMSEMTYYSTSPFVYSQTVGINANQVDVIYLPKAAVEFVGKSNLYYVGNNTPTLFNAYGEDATQFTMYDTEGNEVKMWIEGDSRKTTTDATFTDATAPATSAHIIAHTYNNKVGNAYDKFYALVPTDAKTISGETIYKIGEVNDDGDTYIAHADKWDANKYPTASTITKASGASAAGTYTATTRDSQVATIYTDTKVVPFNVGSAKVVNLNKTTYPGITDLASLNDAASVNVDQVKVSAVVSDDNNMIVTTIFVAYNQA